jgi:hypothetical protein
VSRQSRALRSDFLADAREKAMTGRTAIATVIEDAYAARCRGDLDGLLKHLTPPAATG